MIGRICRDPRQGRAKVVQSVPSQVITPSELDAPYSTVPSGEYVSAPTAPGARGSSSRPSCARSQSSTGESVQEVTATRSPSGATATWPASVPGRAGREQRGVLGVGGRVLQGGARADQQGAGRCVRHLAGEGLGALDGVDALRGGEIPQLDGAGGAGDREAGPVGRERERQRLEVPDVEDLPGGAGGAEPGPQPHRPVRAERDQGAAVGAEGEVLDAAAPAALARRGVTGQGPQHLSLDGGDLDVLGSAEGEQRAVRV